VGLKSKRKGEERREERGEGIKSAKQPIVAVTFILTDRQIHRLTDFRGREKGKKEKLQKRRGVTVL